MSRTVSVEELRHMAKLSKLEIDSREEELFRHQFGTILEHMGILSQVDTSNIEPLYTPATQDEFTRADVANNTRQREQILANAPQTDGEYFIVPRIV